MKQRSIYSETQIAESIVYQTTALVQWYNHLFPKVRCLLDLLEDYQHYIQKRIPEMTASFLTILPVPSSS